MFDFAWSELGLIAVVALIVIGPKDLPRVLRTVGAWVRKARSIAREFQGSLDEMMREVELDDVKRTINKATSFNLEEEFNKTVDPDGELKRSLSDPLLANPLADHAEPTAAAAEPPPAIAAPAEPAALPAPAEAAPAVEASAEPAPAVEAPAELAPAEPTPPAPAEPAPPAAAEPKPPAAAEPKPPAAAPPEPPRAAERVASSNSPA